MLNLLFIKLKEFYKNKNFFIFISIILSIIIIIIGIKINGYLKKPIEFYTNGTGALYNPYSIIKTKAHAWGVLINDGNKTTLLAQKNGNFPLPLASITKIVSVGSALKNLSKKDEVVIPKQGFDKTILPGEKFTLFDLSTIVLGNSSNKGAESLALEAEARIKAREGIDFISFMNKIYRHYGMFFFNSTGLDKNYWLSGGYGTAVGVGKMVIDQYINENMSDIMEKSAQKEFSVVSKDGLEHKIKNTNEYISSFKNLVASKTGFTDIAKGNLTVLGKIDGVLLSVTVLNSSEKERFIDALKIYNTYIKTNPTDTIFETNSCLRITRDYFDKRS